MKTAVIGAGLAGIACARHLKEVGHDVVVYEKSRGFGGRAATRRIASGSTFDHGAQYFTVRDTAFAKTLAPLFEAGLVRDWHPDVVRFSDGAWHNERLDEETFVGAPRMALLVRALAEELDVRLEHTVVRLWNDAVGWTLHTSEGGQEGPFEALFLAIPVDQAMVLLSDYPEVCGPLKDVEIEPCWAVIAEAARSGFRHDAGYLDAGPIGWFARNNSKPGRPRIVGNDAWVLHATGPWSREHLEEEGAEVADALWQAFAALSEISSTPTFLAAHRWRYARVARPLAEDCVWHDKLALGLCGDWCLGARVEAAWVSGTSLAQKLI